MYKLSAQKGFTLVEMIVSLAIFSVVALVSVGALVKVMDANKKSINLKTAINNLNFALESMTREMRMGDTYDCRNNTNTPIIIQNISVGNCSTSGGEWTIAFRSSKIGGSGNSTCRLVHAYRYKGTTIEKAEANSCNGNLSEGDFYSVVADDIKDGIKINNSVVKVDTETATKQPFIRIYIDGETGAKDRNKTKFSLQTSVSQRPPKN